jgi:hypothetical protein
MYKSQTARGILMGLAIAVATLLVFQVGQMVGYRKARFAENFSNNYERNFLGHKGVDLRVAPNRIPSGHGAAGEIVSIVLPHIMVAGPDNLERAIYIGSSTVIRRFQNEADVSTLKVGEHVVVLGNPDDVGQISAKFIRIIPARMDNFKNKIQ